MKYFGEPWPSGVCDIGVQVPTPVGVPCLDCFEPIEEGDQGSFLATGEPQHRECSLRAVMGGIGHHEDHDYWCVEMADPDGGRTFRESARAVWRLVTHEP